MQETTREGLYGQVTRTHVEMAPRQPDHTTKLHISNLFLSVLVADFLVIAYSAAAM